MTVRKKTNFHGSDANYTEDSKNAQPIAILCQGFCVVRNVSLIWFAVVTILNMKQVYFRCNVFYTYRRPKLNDRTMVLHFSWT